ncbi:alpha/beta fold hydrolase, partial [Candidatus Woesearchaeota archaeon]|nr:alpha/beta fold hydrolase [Candidatus Woesearchaeota archaeon]
LEAVLAIIILAYLHKKIRFYLVVRGARKPREIMKGAKPYFIRKSKKVGALLLHGFTSTPQELRLLAGYLAGKGITVYAPLIAGHGTDVIDLARTKERDWERSAMKSFRKLAREVKHVYVIGSSLGGNLALRIAKRRKWRTRGVVTMGTPMFFRKDTTFKLALPLASCFMNFVKKRYSNERAREIVRSKLQYNELPLNCLNDVVKLMKKSRKDLPRIRAPALVMQSETDELLNKANAEFIYEKLKSKNKSLHFVPDSYHVFCMDRNREPAFRKIHNFIKRTLPAAAK